MILKRTIERRGRRTAAVCVAAAAAAMVATTLTTAATPAWADANGCNGPVCMQVTGDASGYTVVATTRWSFKGHIQFVGPNMWGNGGEGQNPGGAADGRGAGLACIIGWQESGSGWVQVGKPCETIS